MALKFLNKKGWHTGSLRNLESVWKAEQKHEAELKKVDELKKQINIEREAEDLRRLREEAGLAPKQERLEFLYDSGYGVAASTETAVVKEPAPDRKTHEAPKMTGKQVASPVGALFQDQVPVSSNDKWRKLHTDPLVLIKQQELAALARIKNNPVKLEQIRNELKLRHEKEKNCDAEDRKHKKRKKSKDKKHSKDERHRKKHQSKSRHESKMESPPTCSEPRSRITSRYY